MYTYRLFLVGWLGGVKIGHRDKRQRVSPGEPHSVTAEEYIEWSTFDKGV